MVSTSPQNTIERHDIPVPGRSVFRRLLFGVQLTLVLCALLFGTIVTIHVSKTNDLRNLAHEIRVGDDVLEVDMRLGGSTHGYEYGWPTFGAPPTHQGAMYGGSIDNLHEEFDLLIGRIFGGQPSWYTNALSKQFRAWPVVVEYDSKKRVTVVYVDGTQLTSPASQ